MKHAMCHVVYEGYPMDARVRRYTNALVAKGWEVFIVCSKTATEPIREKRGPVTIYRLPIAKKRSSFLRRFVEYLLFQVGSFLVVTYVSVVKGIRFVHVHTLPDFLVFACLVPKILGAKVILDFHELFPEFMQQHRPQLSGEALPIRLLKWQERASFHFASEVIAFHDPAKDILEERCGSQRQVTVVMNGVDPGEMPTVNMVKGGELRIVYNGTINYNLNLELVLRALAIVRTKHPEVYGRSEFHLYGSGPDVENLLGLAKELDVRKVFYHGTMEFQALMRELSSASVCVLPPLKNVYSELYYSLKLTEMIFLKIPVIATRLRTYLRYYDETCITYFDSGDIEGLAEKLVYVHEHPREVARVAQNAFLEYQKYSWPIMQRRYLDLVHRLVGG